MLLLLLACAARIPAPTEPWVPLPPPPAPVTPAAVDVPVPDTPADTPASAVNTPPPALKVCRIEVAVGKLPGGVVVAHGALREDVTSTQSSLLLVHPAGTWLVDGGMAVDFLSHLREIPGVFGLLARTSAKDWERSATPVDALHAVGVEPSELTGAIATHGHYDHLGGLLDIPGVPIWLPAEEIAEAEIGARGEKSAILPTEAKGLLPRAKPIVFDGPAVGPWPTSWDLFGDGSARVIPMPGHTPGSVGVLLTLDGGRRVLAVGDTVWVREGYEQREPKGALAAGFDADRAGTAHQIALLWQLHTNEPDVTVLPAHDRRQWEQLFGEADCLR
ncbi:MAG: MBL fold metallo-hydrolase [Myxococcota bacterium]